ELHNSMLLQRRDGLPAVAERVAVTSLDFDEDDRIAVARDDVNFSTAPAVAPGKNCPPALLERLTREIFAQFSEADPVLRHGRRGVAKPLPSRCQTLSSGVRHYRGVSDTSASASAKIRAAASA